MTHKKETKHSLAERTLQRALKIMARAVIARHNPFVIGVTGSIGKTTTKDAIAHALAAHRRLRKTEKNYNNELGLPLTIIGAESGGSSLRGWTHVVLQWVRAMTDRAYPEILVLEYGIDRPGDMRALTAIAAPHIAVVTRISDAHRAFFPDTKAIAQEKGYLVEALHAYTDTDLPSAAILNADDARVLSMRARTQKSVYTYGTTADADVHASHIAQADDGGLVFKLGYKERSIPIRLPGIIAPHHITSILAALSVAQILRVNLLTVAEALQTYTTPPSRMHLLPGHGDWQVIDDTYNASPDATIAAIETLGMYHERRRIAVLGDMLELGEVEQQAHASLAKTLAHHEIDQVICVGERMRSLYDALIDTYAARVAHVDTPMDAAARLQTLATSGDIILVKGSQGMRMEIVVAALTPESQHSQICRQDAVWRRRPFVQP